jgi:hypothetical protein
MLGSKGVQDRGGERKVSTTARVGVGRDRASRWGTRRSPVDAMGGGGLGVRGWLSSARASAAGAKCARGGQRGRCPPSSATVSATYPAMVRPRRRGSS